ncbi:putative cutinase cut2 [Mycolicibacterium anyangense]|uniref:Cutinase n=1 Tax=Mycolicibacterium anyangense TaxID=1431246 RepID=A0A6N4WIJ4_9MYCO|nr:cutinase family protein [Mycolicibacterium anyangense]BBZ79702.1 putative cutinase cut2 [Mycolicibacterium anyangense]
MAGMQTKRLLSSLTAVMSAAAVMLLAPAVSPSDSPVSAPKASAAPCPEVEVVFARGRVEPPGTGKVGQAFVDALRSKTSKNVGFYAVNYPADYQVDVGANDMSKHIQYMAKNCPNTRLVLGGYSLGAAVTDLVLAAPSPVFGYNNPLPLGMDGHVAAVALFGNGTRKVFGPVSDNSPLWGDKTIDLCTPDDPICNDNMDPESWAGNWNSHLQAAYIDSGLVDQAASFVAGKL